MMIKYRVHEVAKDLNVPSKEIIDLLQKHFGEVKKHMTALTEEELDVIFEHYTQLKALPNFDAYFAENKTVAEDQAAQAAAEAMEKAKAAAAQEPAKAAAKVEKSQQAAKKEAKPAAMPIILYSAMPQLKKRSGYSLPNTPDLVELETSASSTTTFSFCAPYFKSEAPYTSRLDFAIILHLQALALPLQSSHRR